MTGDDVIPRAAVDDLTRRLRGRATLPGGPAYDAERVVWNGLVDRRPALIVHCADDDDVAIAVAFARAFGLPVAVRGGGHGVAGLAVADASLVVDLSALRQVEVDTERMVVRAQGGATLGDVDRATQVHGLATPLGVVSRTGIAGLTLSGGIGWLRREHGLSCDNLVSARVVIADGRRVTASATEHRDLFWAIRGGGGNFGVVTSFTYRLHRVGPETSFCYVLYPASLAEEVLEAGDRLAATSDRVSPLAVMGRVPEVEELPVALHGQLFVALLALYPGDAAEGERVLAAVRELGGALADFSDRLPYTDAQSALDADYPDGDLYYWKSLNVPVLTGPVVRYLADHAAAAPSPRSTVDVWWQGGAVSRVAEADTAFANRQAPYLIGVEANWDDPAASQVNIAWVRETVADLQRFSEGGTYLNFPGFLEDGEQLLRDGYGGNLERLVQVKTEFDPDNVFRFNANVPPTRLIS